MIPNPLLLATESKYKIGLFKRLLVDFDSLAPQIDETPLPGESAQEQAKRLAYEKAKTVSLNHPDRYILACDQSADCKGHILSKPGTPENAFQQLSLMSGNIVLFYTTLCLFNPISNRFSTLETPTQVKMRPLSEQEIRHYVKTEPALDCAGSYKAEGFGIHLCDSIRSDDPTALIGLPLIATSTLLKAAKLFPNS